MRDWKKPVSSNNLEEKLKQAIDKREKIEQDYRDTNQKFWTIMFIDVSTSAKAVWDQGEQVANVIFDLYQKQVRAVLEQKNSCFIEPGGGPQIVCCFEDPAQAILAAKAVMTALEDWNQFQEDDFKLLPCIGIHQGYIVYYDGLIHQSNTNNMAKRIQTQAAPGQILISEDLYETLNKDKRFSLRYLRTANLKNIPQPQKIYEAKVLVDIGPVNADEGSKALEGSADVPEESGDDKTFHHWVIVYIDVCESTKKFWSFGDRHASSLIQEYQTLCHRSFTSCRSAFVKSCEGDQIFAAFSAEDADMAVVSSVLIMQSLFRRNINVPQNKQVRAAIGIHIGEVAMQGEELIQTKDMRAGKGIQSQASADEILLSEELSRMLNPDYGPHIEEYGTCEFSGLSEPYKVMNLKWFRVPPKLATAPPPVRQAKQPHRFPAR